MAVGGSVPELEILVRNWAAGAAPELAIGAVPSALLVSTSGKDAILSW